MLSNCSRVGSVTIDVLLPPIGGALMLLLLIVLAGSWGAGALFTSRPSDSIFRWSLGGGTGFGGTWGMA